MFIIISTAFFISMFITIIIISIPDYIQIYKLGYKRYFFILKSLRSISKNIDNLNYFNINIDKKIFSYYIKDINNIFIIKYYLVLPMIKHLYKENGTWFEKPITRETSSLLLMYFYNKIYKKFYSFDKKNIILEKITISEFENILNTDYESYKRDFKLNQIL